MKDNRPQKIRDFRRLVRRFEREIDRRIGNSSVTGVSLAQCHAIVELGDLGDASLGELAAALGLDKSTTSRTVEGLVAIGLVNRVEKPGNRRSALISLTEQGKSTCERINRINDSWFQRVFRGIPAERHAGFIENFGMLIDSMAENNREGGDDHA